MTRVYAVSAAAVVIALMAGVAWFGFFRGGDDKYAGCRQSAVAGGTGAIGGPFTLVDQTGRTVTDADVITVPSLIYFGYTFCPDVCPLDNARNVEAVDILEEMGHEVTPVFISIDPKRDTPEVLAEFAGFMHPRMIALTGTDEQVRAASRAYRTYFKVQDTGDEFYLVDHTTFSYLVLPQVGFVEYFRRDLDADALASQISCFLDAR